MLTFNSTALHLDRTLAVSQAQINEKVNETLSSLIQEAIVKVFHDHYYRVDFGPGVKPEYHIVSHDLYCSCALEQDCPAVVAVEVYLQEGGEPAREPNPGYFLTVPHACPICGAKAYYCPRLSSHNRGIGWECGTGGKSHYWRHEFAVLQAVYAEKWKRLGVDPASFKKELLGFSFKDGYNPERIPE